MQVEHKIRYMLSSEQIKVIRKAIRRIEEARERIGFAQRKIIVRGGVGTQLKEA